MSTIPDGPLAGLDAKLYYNAGTTDTPTWTEVERARDVAISDFGVNQVEANSRESKWEAYVNGLIKLGMTFTYLHSRGTDTVRDALLGMVTGRTAKEFAVMDGDITLDGAQGVRAYFNMEKFAPTQDLEGAQVWDASLKPAYRVESGSRVEPSYYVVSSD